MKFKRARVAKNILYVRNQLTLNSQCLPDVIVDPRIGLVKGTLAPRFNRMERANPKTTTQIEIEHSQSIHTESNSQQNKLTQQSHNSSSSLRSIHSHGKHTIYTHTHLNDSVFIYFIRNENILFAKR